MVGDDQGDGGGGGIAYLVAGAGALAELRQGVEGLADDPEARGVDVCGKNVGKNLS